MPQYQYRVRDGGYKNQVEVLLNTQGHEGWEPIEFVSNQDGFITTVIFRRPLQGTPYRTAGT